MRRALDILYAFFAWWLGELAGLIPVRLRDLVFPERPLLVVDLGETALSIQMIQRGVARSLGSVEHGGDQAAAAPIAIARITKKVRLGRTTVALRLPADQILRRTLQLPLAAESDLRGALYFQIDRQTPFAPDSVYYDHVVQEREPALQRLTVELAVARREVVRAAADNLKAWGLTPEIVDVTSDRPEAPLRFNLLPNTPRPTGRRLTTRLNAALGVLVLLLGIAAVYTPLARQAATLSALQDRLAEVRTEAEEAEGLRAEIQRIHQRRDFPVREKLALVPRVVVLEELTRLLPDDTWLSQLSIAGNEVQIRGFSPAASNLVGLLDRAPLFQAPKFRSPVTRDRREGLEQFNLSFEATVGSSDL